jgi:hypothetical protein
MSTSKNMFQNMGWTDGPEIMQKMRNTSPFKDNRIVGVCLMDKLINRWN